jgi:ferric-dicitrate binding protein FerR (iron transport regulator)
MSCDEEAARWFASLRRGLMTLEERTALEQWMRRRENRDALATMGDLWQSLEGTVPPQAQRPRTALKLAFAAICVLSLGTGIMSSMQGASFWTSLDWTSR